MHNQASRRRFLTHASLAWLGLCSQRLTSQLPSSAATILAPCGPLRGEQAGDVRVFRGVPFAEPPVGPLRFRAPVGVKPWTAERDATRFAPSAMQPLELGIEHSEDCLYLNIWAPRGPGPFPVYVWIHGGGFTAGHSFEPMYDGTVLANAGVVCVTVAYRLGVFGFLDMEPLLGADYAGSANNGLRDLIASLQWVQQNIAAFGGDPKRVTVGGESAGAKLTCILMGVPSAQPLFHQMISESGGAERVWPREQSHAVGLGFAGLWRTESGDGGQTIATAPADKILQVQRRFVAEWTQHFPLRPQLDGALLPSRPLESIARGSSRGKRLLIGTNRDESALFLGPHPLLDPAAKDLGNIALADFSPVFKKYRALYPQMTEQDLRIRAVTAEEYWVPSLRVTDAHVKGGGDAWMYRLDFSETSSLMRGKAFHSLDVRMVWDRPSPLAANAAAEAALAMQMFGSWVAFIKGEQPSAAGVPFWPEYNSSSRPTMVFDTQNHVDEKPQEAELRLWDGVL